jgi:DHA1 family tetracycline resistance protein-like MFS transporter
MAALGGLGRFLALEGNIRIMAVQLLVSQFGFGMMYVVFQPYILSLGISITDLGVIQSVISLSTAAGLVFWGAVSDRVGRKPALLMSNASRLVAMAVLIASGNTILLFAFAFFLGFSALWMQANPARSTLISESVGPGNRATAYSTLMAITQIVNMVAASAGGYIAIVAGYYPIFYACIVGDVAGLILLLLYAKETHHPEAKGGRSSLTTTLRRYLIPERRILPLYAIMLAMGFGYNTGYGLINGALVETYSFNTLQLGIMSTAFSLVWGVSSIPIGKLADRVGRKPMLLTSCFFAVATGLGFIISGSFEGFVLFNALSAFDPACWTPSWVSLVSEKVPPSERSTALGKLDAYGRFAGIPAPYLAGVLYTGYGFAAPLLVLVGLALVWSLIVLRLDTSSDGGV